MMAIKAILFDKDGTLIDSNRTWVPLYRHLLAEELTGDDLEIDALMQSAGLDLDTGQFRAGSILAGGTTRQLVDLWWPALDDGARQAMTTRIDRDYAPKVCEFLAPLMPLPGILSELTAMGMQLGVGTNDGHHSATRQVEFMGLQSYFRVVLGADSVERAKPSGDMVRAFALHCGVEPHEVAMVGDNTHDMEEAEHGGAGLGIAVLSGNGDLEHLSPLADHVIDSVADLPRLLKGL
jgi:phosphoglycolate phosphatase